MYHGVAGRGLHLAGNVVRNTVLIVEDNASLRDAPCELCKRKRDFAVRGVAENGPETIEVAGRRDPDLIGLDLFLPEMNGLDVPLILYRALDHSLSEPAKLIRISEIVSKFDLSSRPLMKARALVNLNIEFGR